MINKEMYLVHDRVWYSDINMKGNLGVVPLVDHFQNGAYANAADLGHSVSVLSKEKKAWLLASWNIYIKRYPKLDEKIILGTGPYNFKGILGYRNNCMWDENEELIAWADAIWFFFDGNQGRPVRPTPSDSFERYNMIEGIEMEHEPRKIFLPDEMTTYPPRQVDWRTIDTNQHVNNSQYVGMALDVLDRFMEPRHIRVEYVKAAVLGDMIVPRVGEKDGRIVVDLSDGNGQTYASVEIEE